jgi:hypothetical protein
MHTFRPGQETWKHIAVGQEQWPCPNPPITRYGRPTTFEGYYHTRWIAEPFCRFDPCLKTGGKRRPWRKVLSASGESKKTVLPDFSPEGCALDAQFPGRFRTIAPIFFQCSFDNFCFGFPEGSLFL